MSFKSTMKKTGRKIWKHAPSIAIVAGIGTGIAATIIACQKTDGFKEIKAKTTQKYNDIQECEQKGITIDDDGKQIEYTPSNARLDRFIVGKDLCFGFVKNYWLPLSLGATSIALITFSHIEMSKRNAALGAAVTSLANAFAAYRQNLINTVPNGEEIDKACQFGVHDEYIKDNAYDDKGNIVASEEVKQTVANANLNSAYTFIFGPDNKYWRNDITYNLDFLQMVQNQLNNKLKADGYLTLATACKELGLKCSKDDMPFKLFNMVGWVYGYKDATGGDGYVDFRVFELNNAMVRCTSDVMENGIIINFNVDGAIDDIVDQIERSR